jgi:hypothetical protein
VLEVATASGRHALALARARDSAPSLVPRVLNEVI